MFFHPYNANSRNVDDRERYIAEKRPIKVIYVGSPLPQDVQAFLENIPEGATLVASGGSLADFSNLNESDWKDIEVVLIRRRPFKTTEVLLLSCLFLVSLEFRN